MHIPDGYLGPETYGSMLVVMVPIWTKAYNSVNKFLKEKDLPLLAILAAFSFVIMMFNIPIPGGTTGHAVGSVLIAILLGPWASVLVISIVLIIQALIFGDGGLTAIGANCFNMAFAMPLVGYYVYKILKGKASLGSKREIISAGVGAYIGINVAALLTAIEFGIQPYIAKDVNGLPLYCPYPLKVAVPAMMIEHLLIFGVVEAVVTIAALYYLRKISTVKEG